MTPQKIENLALDLTKAGKASPLSSALASNSYNPSAMFKTSCNVSSRLVPAMQVVVNGVKQPVVHALFQNMENNMEKFMDSNDAVEISQKAGFQKTVHIASVLILCSKQTAPVRIYKSQSIYLHQLLVR